MDAAKRAMMNVSSLNLLPVLGAGRRLSCAAVCLMKAIRKWNHNRKTRKILLGMSDRMLKDIGISRADALREGRKPFWRN